MKTILAQFDSALTHAVQALPSWLSPLMYGLSFIGRPVFTIATICIVGIYALAIANMRLALAALTAGATFGVNSLLKVLIHRPRPDGYRSEDVLLPTYSFPSGHAASTVVTFGLLAYVLYHHLPAPWGLISSIIIAIIIIGIGISRVFIGAHYPSDVLIGWLVGGIGLAIIIWVIKPL